MWRYFSRLLAASTFISTALASVECSSSAIESILPSNATLNFAVPVPQNGSFGQGPSDLEFPQNATNLPPLCAISVNVKSSDTSSYNFGLFLPETWNSRFLASGNGGFGGGINWPDMGISTQYGFAGMATDTGHISAVFNASWALNNPEGITDWAYRAMHGSVVLSKQIIQSYYSAPIVHSYYSSCSTGGRQGLKEIQLYPADFDGILAGAPAWWTSHLQTWTVAVALHDLPNSSPGHIPNTLFPTILNEILRQCDSQDGATDGLITDPYASNFYPDTLLCTSPLSTSAANETSCLTPAQLDTLRTIYSDYIDTNQTFVFPHLALGADPTPLVGTDFTYAPNPAGTSWVQNFLVNDSNWNYTDFSLATVQLADQLNPGTANADDYDLSAFRDRGGKLLMYHGLADPLIPTGSSMYFYDQVLRNMSSSPTTSSSSLRKRQSPTTTQTGNVLDPFYRLFLVPGMGHCGGSASPFSSAPWWFGQGGAPVPTGTGYTHGVPGFEDREHNALLALMEWVEGDGRAPETLVATKYVNDTVDSGVLRQGLLCKYPGRVRYRGGDPEVVGSWECQGV